MDKSARTDSDKAATAESIPTQVQEIWRRMALSQLDRRQEAEAENVSLRKMVAIQVCEAKNLRRLLKRRTRIEMMEDMLGMKGMMMLKQTPEDDSAIFRMLSQDADALYHKIDSLFATKDMDGLPFTGHSRDVALAKVNGAYYEVRQKRRVPFSLLETGNALWQCLGRLGITNMRDVGGSEVRLNSHSDPLKAQEDELQTTFSVVISGFGDLIGTHNWKVVRRYKDDKRVVVICRIVSEPKFQAGHSGITGTTTTHVVVEPCGTDTTVMKIYFSAERDISADSEDTTTPLSVAAWDEIVPRIACDVETILLESNKGGNWSGLLTGSSDLSRK